MKVLVTRFSQYIRTIMINDPYGSYKEHQNSFYITLMLLLFSFLSLDGHLWSLSESLGASTTIDAYRTWTVEHDWTRGVCSGFCQRKRKGIETFHIIDLFNQSNMVASSGYDNKLGNTYYLPDNLILF